MHPTPHPGARLGPLLMLGAGERTAQGARAGPAQLLFKDIFLKLIEAPTATLTQKAMIMQALGKVCSNPQTLVDLFLNYDCDVNGDDLFESMVNVVSHVTRTIRAPEGSDASALGDVRKIRSRGVNALVALARSLLEWGSVVDDAAASDETYVIAMVAAVPPLASIPLFLARRRLCACADLTVVRMTALVRIPTRRRACPPGLPWPWPQATRWTGAGQSFQTGTLSPPFRSRRAQAWARRRRCPHPARHPAPAGRWNRRPRPASPPPPRTRLSLRR